MEDSRILLQFLPEGEYRNGVVPWLFVITALNRCGLAVALSGIIVAEDLLMATPLIDYLVEVDMNPTAATAFRKNPSAAMKAAGLSKKLRTIVQSNDSKKIAGAIFQEKPSAVAICPVIRNFVTV